MKNILLTTAITLVASTSVYAEALKTDKSEMIYQNKSEQESLSAILGGGGAGCCPTGFEKLSRAKEDHKATRKQGLETREAIVTAIETSIEQQTLDLKEIIERQTAEQIKQFQAQTKALANYFTTQDERMRQREIDSMKFDAMKQASTDSSTCGILTNLRRKGVPATDTGTETAGSAIRGNPHYEALMGVIDGKLTEQPSGTKSSVVVGDVIAGMSNASNTDMGVEGSKSTGNFEFESAPYAPIDVSHSVFNSRREMADNQDIWNNPNWADEVYNPEYQDLCAAFSDATSGFTLDNNEVFALSQVSDNAGDQAAELLRIKAARSAALHGIAKFCAQRTPSETALIEWSGKTVQLSPNDYRMYQTTKLGNDTKLTTKAKTEDVELEQKLNHLMTITNQTNNLLNNMLEELQLSNMHLSMSQLNEAMMLNQNRTLINKSNATFNEIKTLPKN